MSVVEQLARLRKRSGVSLAELAARTGLQASNLSAIEHGRRDPRISTTVDWAHGLGAEVLVIGTHGRATDSRCAEAIRGYVEAADGASAYRAFVQLNDDLAGSSPFDQVLLVAAPPSSIDARWDAAIAGLVEWRLRQKRAPTPAWAADLTGDPNWRWAPGEGTRLFEADPDQVPPRLLERGIWIEQGELESA